jgi:hypothetical protein
MVTWVYTADKQRANQPPCWVAGLRRAISRAASRSGASITQKPATTSLASMKGPSVTTSPRIEVAVAAGCIAKAATMAPDFTTSSACRSCGSSSSAVAFAPWAESFA